MMKTKIRSIVTYIQTGIPAIGAKSKIALSFIPDGTCPTGEATMSVAIMDTSVQQSTKTAPSDAFGITIPHHSEGSHG
jgi:hypothetical protein